MSFLLGIFVKLEAISLCILALNFFRFIDTLKNYNSKTGVYDTTKSDQATIDEIYNYVASNYIAIDSSAVSLDEGTVIVVMSNGDFGGLIKRIHAIGSTTSLPS